MSRLPAQKFGNEIPKQEYGSSWVMNSNFQTQLEYGCPENEAMVCSKEHIIYADSPVPRIPSCMEDVWAFPEPDPMIKLPKKIHKKD